jgi:hypothetical protein
LLLFRVQNAQCSEVVFDLLECLEGGLTIGRDGSVIVGASLLRERAEAAPSKRLSDIEGPAAQKRLAS